MRNTTNTRKLVVLAATTAIIAIGAAAMPASAQGSASNYGSGAQYQIELSGNVSGSNQGEGVGGLGGGGVWLWIALYPDGTGDYAGSDCGHAVGAVADKGDVAWWYINNDTQIKITGVQLNGLGGYPTTITIPAEYGHYTGTVSDFLTLPGFIPVGIGSAQLQVAR